MEKSTTNAERTLLRVSQNSNDDWQTRNALCRIRHIYETLIGKRETPFAVHSEYYERKNS